MVTFLPSLSPLTSSLTRIHFGSDLGRHVFRGGNDGYGSAPLTALNTAPMADGCRGGEDSHGLQWALLW